MLPTKCGFIRPSGFREDFKKSAILKQELLANPIDWLYAACLEYFIFFSIDSSEARKQDDEYCLS
jgi:hypothetical protein